MNLLLNQTPLVPLPNWFTFAFGFPAGFMLGILVGVVAARLVWFDVVREIKEKQAAVDALHRSLELRDE